MPPILDVPNTGGWMPPEPLGGAVIGTLRLHGGCKSDKSASPKRVFALVRPAFVHGSPDWTRSSDSVD